MVPGTKYGVFRYGVDINIANNANTRIDSSSNLGHTYSHPQYEEDTNEAGTFLSGSNFN